MSDDIATRLRTALRVADVAARFADEGMHFSACDRWRAFAILVRDITIAAERTTARQEAGSGQDQEAETKRGLR